MTVKINQHDKFYYKTVHRKSAALFFSLYILFFSYKI